MKITESLYQDMVARHTPKTRHLRTIPLAFVIGGAICMVGECLRSSFLSMGWSTDAAGGWTSVILVFVSALLTGLGLYEKLAQYAGAGTLVPITGFANGVASAAIEARTEGFILGVGTKIFTIAGPVILYGMTASVAYGLLYQTGRVLFS